MANKVKKVTKTHEKLSYSSTIAEINMEVMTVKDRLEYMAETYPNKVAFIFHMNGGLELTYSEIKEKSFLLARNFMSLGLKKGDRIAFLLPNTYELLIGYYAAALAGLISVPFDASYGSKQIDFMLKNTEPSAVVVYDCEEYHDLILGLFPEILSGKPNEFKSENYTRLKNVIVIDDHENKVKSKFSSALSYNDLELKLIDKDLKEFPYVDSDDIFGIMSTSGTTSRPKGTIRTYSNFFNAALAEKSFSDDFPFEMKVCQTLLMYHMGATYSIMSKLVNSKNIIVFPSYKLDPVGALEAVEKYKCNFIVSLPKNLANMLDENRTRKHDLSSLLVVNVGGQHVGASLIERVKKELSNLKYFAVSYGSTECLAMSTFLIDLNTFSPDTYKSIVGQPFPFVECKIVNPENGQIQPHNVEGELHVRSFMVTQGYWNDPENTKKSIDSNGWFNLGDYLSMDKNGTLYFHSRSKEIISAKGGDRLDVFPSVVEACLLKHPNIKEAIVFGIPINDFEQEICAWVKLRSNEVKTSVEEIVKHCQSNLLEFQVPRYVKIVESFPISQMGKYLRNEMTSIYRKELGI